MSLTGNFEKRILKIYQKCRSPDDIEAAFQSLREELEEAISQKMDETRSQLLEYFDEDVHAHLRVQLDQTKIQLDRFSRLFWALTQFILRGDAQFNDSDLTFLLNRAVCGGVKPGQYHLISKTKENVTGDFLYRLSHPLGEYVVREAKALETPPAKVTFDITGHPTKLTIVEELKGKTGWLILQRLIVDSFQREEYLLFSALDADGRSVNHEVIQKMFLCGGFVGASEPAPEPIHDRLTQDARQHVRATVNRSMERNNTFFIEERDRLEKWADDMVLAAEKELQDTKAQIKAINRQARQAVTVKEQHEFQKRVKELERQKRRQRQRIFDAEDEIAEKRDRLIDGLEKRMEQKTSVEPLFTVQWEVV